jgi:hypothetical protein
VRNIASDVTQFFRGKITLLHLEIVVRKYNLRCLKQTCEGAYVDEMLDLPFAAYRNPKEGNADHWSNVLGSDYSDNSLCLSFRK